MDFNLKTYCKLIETLKSQGFLFSTVTEYCRHEEPQVPFIILRHDVEARYENALRFAEIQYRLGIRGSYYFRIMPKAYNGAIIKQIAEMGHEVGYHYDDLAHCRGDFQKAFYRFRKNLDLLRSIAPVETICMDGSPRSKYDNKKLWSKFDYKSLGIIGEPYFDVNFDEVFYLTDTGRRWDGWRVSVRDKVRQQEEWIRQGLVFRTTSDIIKASNEGRLPDQIMMTFHPQRWSDKPLPWVKELVVSSNLQSSIFRKSKSPI